MEAYYYLVALALVIVIPHAFASDDNGSVEKNPATYVNSQRQPQTDFESNSQIYDSGQLPNEDSLPPRILSYWQRNAGIKVPPTLNDMIYDFTYDFNEVRLTYHTPNNNTGDGVDANCVQDYLDNMRFALYFDYVHTGVKQLNVPKDKNHVYMNGNNFEIVLKTDGKFHWDTFRNLISPNASMQVFVKFDTANPANVYDDSNEKLLQAHDIIFCGFEESKISVKYLWYTLECVRPELSNFHTVNENGRRFGIYFWVSGCKFVS
eukprot:23038_1